RSWLLAMPTMAQSGSNPRKFPPSRGRMWHSPAPPATTAPPPTHSEWPNPEYVSSVSSLLQALFPPAAVYLPAHELRSAGVELDATLRGVGWAFCEVKTLRFFNVFPGDQATGKQPRAKTKRRVAGRNSALIR